jgi:hypothetical protein
MHDTFAPRHLYVVHSTLAQCVREVPFSNSRRGTAIVIDFRRLSSDTRGSCRNILQLDTTTFSYIALY